MIRKDQRRKLNRNHEDGDGVKNMEQPAGILQPEQGCTVDGTNERDQKRASEYFLQITDTGGLHPTGNSIMMETNEDQA